MGDRSLVSTATRDRLRLTAQPLAVAVGRLGLTPNSLTLLGFLISAFAALLAGLGLWFLAGVIGLIGAACDMLDGGLARATGRTSRLGAFYDSTFDRWGEAVVYAGIAAGALLVREPVTGMLAAVAMSSAFMVSYTRAKAESLGFRGEVGIAPRPERVGILTAGLVLSGLTGGPLVTPWLQLSLGILVVLTTITTIQRILYVRQQAAEAEVDR
jgi:CDP-diacylglycerol--glycerol-3-phosphate 3-phosphatidyltransferase